LFEDYKYGTLPRFRLKKSAQYHDHDINPELRQKLIQIDKKDHNLFNNSFDHLAVSYLIKASMQEF
jgi:hypothetical protein